MSNLEAWDDAPYLYPDRWSESACWDVVRCNGWEALRTWGVPLDYSGMLKTKEEVPYSQKVLDRMCKKYSSASPEFAPRIKSDANYHQQNLAQHFPHWTPTAAEWKHLRAYQKEQSK
jgi:hypothetical protein